MWYGLTLRMSKYNFHVDQQGYDQCEYNTWQNAIHNQLFYVNLDNTLCPPFGILSWLDVRKDKFINRYFVISDSLTKVRDGVDLSIYCISMRFD